MASESRSLQLVGRIPLTSGRLEVPLQPAIASIPEWTLGEALAAVARVFNTQELASRDISLDDVADYYQQSDRGYRLFHSSEGALHIALGCDGHDDTSCFDRQARLFAKHMQAVDARSGVEFGCGMGFNTRAVAEMLPECEMLGIDLTEPHIKFCEQKATAETLRYRIANYEHVDLEDDSCDGVLAVETLCQTSSMRAALAEAFRILRPRGRLVVVDCFRSAPLESFDEDQQQAALLVEKATAVHSFSIFDEWVELCESLGFRNLETVDHSAETELNLQRLHRLAAKFYRLPRAVTSMAKVFPRKLLENSACGLMMPYTVGGGVHVYCSAVFEKPGEATNE